MSAREHSTATGVEPDVELAADFRVDDNGVEPAAPSAAHHRVRRPAGRELLPGASGDIGRVAGQPRFSGRQPTMHGASGPGRGVPVAAG